MSNAVSAWLGKQLLARSTPGGEEVLTSPAPYVRKYTKVKNLKPKRRECVSNVWKVLTALFTCQPQGSSSQDTERRSGVGDLFNVDLQSLGRVESALELLGRQAR